MPEAGQSKINAEDNGKRPGLCSEDMDDVSGGKWEVMLQPRVTWVVCGHKAGCQ